MVVKWGWETNSRLQQVREWIQTEDKESKMVGQRKHGNKTCHSENNRSRQPGKREQRPKRNKRGTTKTEILGMLLDNLKLQFSFFLFPQIGIKMTVLTELERGLNKLKLKMVLFHSHYYHRGQCDILCRVSGENIMEK